MHVQLVFSFIALIFILFSVLDYSRNEKSWTVRGKVWFRLGLVFAAISAYLIWMNLH